MEGIIKLKKKKKLIYTIYEMKWNEMIGSYVK